MAPLAIVRTAKQPLRRTENVCVTAGALPPRPWPKRFQFSSAASPYRPEGRAQADSLRSKIKCSRICKAASDTAGA